MQVREYTTKVRHKKWTMIHQFRLMDVTFFKMNKASHLMALPKTTMISEIITAGVATP